MASYVTPKKGVEFIFYISLVSQASTKVMQSNPTISAGDFKVSIDGGALANPATLPAVTPASSKMVKVTLSTTEMDGDNITFVASDASGAEWCDLVVNIQTSARQIDDLAYPAVSGRSTAIDASGQVTVGTIAANVITPTAIQNDAFVAAKFAADVTTELQSGLATAASVATLQTSVDDLPTNGELATALAAADDAVLTAVATRASQSSVDDLPTNTELATSQAAADDATLAAIAAVDAKMDTIDNLLDTEVGVLIAGVAAILDDTGTAGVVVAAASKTGYALSATGLDSISIAAPAGVASNFREMMVAMWRRHFKKTTLTATELKTFADNGSTVLTTQVASDDLTVQTLDSAT